MKDYGAGVAALADESESDAVSLPVPDLTVLMLLSISFHMLLRSTA